MIENIKLLQVSATCKDPVSARDNPLESVDMENMQCGRWKCYAENNRLRLQYWCTTLSVSFKLPPFMGKSNSFANEWMSEILVKFVSNRKKRIYPFFTACMQLTLANKFLTRSGSKKSRKSEDLIFLSRSVIKTMIWAITLTICLAIFTSPSQAQSFGKRYAEQCHVIYVAVCPGQETVL